MGFGTEKRDERALRRAYAVFSRRYPSWAASLFDETFLRRALAAGADDPASLALAWTRQLAYRDEVRRSRDAAALAPVAAAFLELFERERRSRGRPAAPARALALAAEGGR